jgi:hypothetical protein
MSRSCDIVVERPAAAVFAPATLLRMVGGSLVAPLLAAGVIAGAAIVSFQHPAEPGIVLRAAPAPIVEAPAFVRTPRLSPDDLICPKA